MHGTIISTGGPAVGTKIEWSYIDGDGATMAITSIDIDRDLLHDAKEVLGAPTNREAVQWALEYTIMTRRQRIAFERISEREFTDVQIHAPMIAYS